MRFAIATLVLFLVSATFAVAQSGSPEGVWLTQAGDARVRISRCGAALCGNIVGLRDKVDPATGRPPVDDKNRDPSRAKRPMMGLQLFSDMRPSGAGKWSGHIYNADDGNTYASNLSVAGADSLRVEGCVGAICGGESWNRVR